MIRKGARPDYRAGFYAEAERRYAEFMESGESIPWTEMRSYLEAWLAGKAVKLPVPRKLDDDVMCVRQHAELSKAP